MNTTSSIASFHQYNPPLSINGFTRDLREEYDDEEWNHIHHNHTIHTSSDLPMSRDTTMDVSFHASSIDDSENSTTPINRNTAPGIFICGYVHKRWHNGSLNTILTDLAPHYYVSCNGACDFSMRTRQLIAHSECALFFVNEYTLADVSCLLSLQYAWQLMIPIIMLRPPRTKLVITARASSRLRSHTIVQKGTVVRSPSVGFELQSGVMEHGVTDESGLDYALLQDILYEGYRIAVVYDRLDHTRSMEAVRSRITRACLPFHLTTSSHQSAIGLEMHETGYDDEDEDDDDDVMERNGRSRSTDKLSTSNGHGKHRRPPTPGNPHRLNEDSGERQSKSKSPCPPRKNRTETRLSGSTSTTSSRIRLSQSTGSLAEGKRTASTKVIPPTGTGPVRVINGRNRVLEQRKAAPLAPIKVDRPDGDSGNSEISPTTNTSLSSPLDRRMSMMSLEDVTNYRTTQYLVFPIHDPSKKPQLIRFPHDLIEENDKLDSPWGSDSDLEEEVDIAPRIQGALSIDMEDGEESRICSPAPYMPSLA